MAVAAVRGGTQQTAPAQGDEPVSSSRHETMSLTATACMMDLLAQQAGALEAAIEAHRAIAKALAEEPRSPESASALVAVAAKATSPLLAQQLPSAQPPRLRLGEVQPLNLPSSKDARLRRGSAPPSPLARMAPEDSGDTASGRQASFSASLAETPVSQTSRQWVPRMLRASTAPDGQPQDVVTRPSRRLSTLFQRSVKAYVDGQDPGSSAGEGVVPMSKALTSPRKNSRVLTEPLLAEQMRRMPSPTVAAANFRPPTDDGPGEDLEPSSSPVHVMLSAEEMKRRVIKALKEPSSLSEMGFYSEIGFWQMAAKHNLFQGVTFMVVLFSVFWIAIEIDYNDADVLCNAPLVFQVVDNLVCLFFLAEILIRIMAFERKLDVLRSPSLMLDAIIALSMVWDTWIEALLYLYAGFGTTGRRCYFIRIFRLLRLGRIARTARVLNVLPELRILAKGMLMALRSVCSIICLLFFVVYIFAIVFTQSLAGSQVGKEYFNTVPHAMHFLLMQTLCGFDAAVFAQMLDAHWLYYILYLVFLFLGSMTVMNLLIGVLCEVVSVVAEVEEEETFFREAMHKLGGMLITVDEDNDQRISATEFQHLLDNDVLVRELKAQGIDVIGLVDYAGFVFRDDRTVTVHDFLEMIVQFRGSKPATVKDLVDMRKFFAGELRRSLVEAEEEAEEHHVHPV